MVALCDFIELFSLEHRVGVTAHEAHGSVLSCDPLEVLLKHLGRLVLCLHKVDIQESSVVACEAQQVMESSH